MPHSSADLFARLSALAIPVETVEHPPLFTVAEAKAVSDGIPGGHSKNLFLKDKKGRLFLVVAEADAVVDLKRLHERIGASGRLSFGSAELLFDILGVTPGSVTPFAAINDAEGRVTVFIDRTLMGFDRVNFHPLVNTATTTITPAGLLAFLRSTGHEPQIIDLAAVAADL